MRFRKTSVESNEDLLDAVKQILATEARREEVRALSAMDGMDLADPDIMARAWRP
jgi:hypothetical protein